MFYFDDFWGKKILKSTLLKDYDCFFTTRDFVLTPASRLDLVDEAEKNLNFLEEKLDTKIVTCRQVHSDNVAIANNDSSFFDETDAIISSIEGSTILLNFADCVPIILYSKKDNIGGVVHAGWRGTAKEIVKNTVVKMNVNPSNIVALIGPSIGKCCFETDEDVFKQLVFDNDFSLYEKKNDKFYIDLKKLNYKQLLETGVECIDICNYCTCCMSDIFFSYRKEKGITARHSAIVKIKRG